MRKTKSGRIILSQSDIQNKNILENFIKDVTGIDFNVYKCLVDKYDAILLEILRNHKYTFKDIRYGKINVIVPVNKREMESFEKLGNIFFEFNYKNNHFDIHLVAGSLNGNTTNTYGTCRIWAPMPLSMFWFNFLNNEVSK